MSSALSRTHVIYKLAALGRLKKNASEDVALKLAQWIEQQPEDQPIGAAIDALWSIVVE